MHRHRAAHRSRLALVLAAAALSIGAAGDDAADRLPSGAGKPAFVRTCGECHGYDSIRKQRLSRDDWSEKLDDMVDRGAKATGEEFAAILDYLTQNFGADSKIWMNTAPFGELKAVLKLTNDETDAMLAYRQRNGGFRRWTDVLKVPGVDARKIEAAKDKMAF
jgi:competence protein ComEA